MCRFKIQGIFLERIVFLVCVARVCVWSVMIQQNTELSLKLDVVCVWSSFVCVCAKPNGISNRCLNRCVPYFATYSFWHCLLGFSTIPTHSIETAIFACTSLFNHLNVCQSHSSCLGQGGQGDDRNQTCGTRRETRTGTCR